MQAFFKNILKRKCIFGNQATLSKEKRFGYLSLVIIRSVMKLQLIILFCIAKGEIKLGLSFSFVTTFFPLVLLRLVIRLTFSEKRRYTFLFETCPRVGDFQYPVLIKSVSTELAHFLTDHICFVIAENKIDTTNHKFKNENNIELKINKIQ